MSWVNVYGRRGRAMKLAWRVWWGVRSDEGDLEVVEAEVEVEVEEDEMARMVRVGARAIGRVGSFPMLWWWRLFVGLN